ncbi:P-loop containing nucleoside triphosphate hydrolase protein [Serendipita vermifera]|nr:P-loop containing nucleoside triphosphate hydrolase protein [Serendipita vermifera]
MPTKKKKAQLKPVVRGFATTSVPSKKSINETDASPQAQEAEQSQNIDEKRINNPSNVLQSESLSPDQQILKTIVEKWQEKTEREINRVLKGIEFDRRMSKGYSHLELDLLWRERILQLVSTKSDVLVPLQIDESEDKLLPRIGLLYGVLRRMHFSTKTARLAIMASKRLDVEEAIEWIHLHGDKVDRTSEPDDSEHDDSQGTQNVGYSHRFISEAPNIIINKATLEKEVVETDIPDVGSTSIKNIASDHNSMDPTWEDEDYADPNVAYALLSLQLLKIRRTGMDLKDKKRVAEIESKLSSVKQDYLFSSRIASEELANRRAAMEAVDLKGRLQRGTGPGQLPTSTVSRLQQSKEGSEKSVSVPSTPLSGSMSLGDHDGEDEDETMFGTLLDERPTEEVSPSGVIISIKDMGLPKQWLGKTPKSLLSEVVSKMDRYATIIFNVISGGSRAVRCSCTIRWAGRKTEEWTMQTVACYDSTQAEQYVATLALHAVTFPALPGFSAGPPNTNPATYYRLLPPMFKTLWNELEVARRLEENNTNQLIWSELRDFLQRKVSRKELSQKLPKDQDDQTDRRIPQYSNAAQEASSDSIKSSLASRQSSAAYQTMSNQRKILPIAAYRQEILQTLENHRVLVLSGETGCGKSTQVPAFIMEDQMAQGKACKVICTEPRRISAISLAQRVSAEMGEPPGVVGTNNSLIGYSIRLESNITKTTRLAFVTNGIALRMLEAGSGNASEAAIDDVTHIIVDEVHERSIESDFLLIILKSLLEQRPKLRVILMSATLDADKVAAYFDNCPTIHVPGRTFPVDVGFLEDAIEFSSWHINENSSSPYAKRGKDKFFRGKTLPLEWVEETVEPLDEEETIPPDNPVILEKRYSQETVTTVNLLDERLIPYDLIVRILERICFEDENYAPYSAAILVFMPGLNEIRRLHDMLLSHDLFSSEAFRIYPLHSTISSEGQSAVFEIPPLGVRKIVISSNISETGVTIPDVTAVIDSGKHRQMMFDEKRQLSRLVETFIAKSNAAQRRGRAGRVRQGICFHLFTKTRYESLMAEHPIPEMLRLSLSDLALRTKIMRVSIGSSIEDILSRALDPPSSLNIQRAVASLVEVGALTSSEEITGLGRYLAQFPTDVSLGKFLIMATIFKCLDPALTIAATLSSKSPFVTPFGKEEEAERQKGSFRIENSDFLTIHNAFSTWRRACNNGQNAARTLCRKSYLSFQNLQQIEEIRQQYLSYLIDSSLIQVDKSYEKELNRSRYNQSRGRPRFVMVPPEFDVHSPMDKPAIINAALVAGLYPKILIIDSSNYNSQQMRTLANNQPAFFHPSSVNFGRKPSDIANGGSCLNYFTLMQSKKLYAWETGPVDDLAMVLLCGEAEFKSASGAVILDRKIKYSLDPKDVLALKHLREKFQKIIQNKLNGRPHINNETSERWDTLATYVLAKKPGDEEAS